MKAKNALTKIERLVVITCIAFLLANIAAIGPAGRSRAKEAACLSTLMKWGQVLEVYTSENNGYFHAREIGTPAGYAKMWHRTYEPYYVDRNMLCCPAANNPYRDLDTFGTWGGPNWPYSEFGNWDPEDYYGSYGFNRYVVNMTGASSDDPAFWRRVSPQDASQVPVLLDCMNVSLSYYHDSEPPEYDGDYTQGQGISLSCINRHDGHVNVCFMDFSARKVGLKELWTLKGNRLFDTCNYYTICGHGGNAHSCADLWDDQAPWMSDFPEY